ncbi:hypothetical protein G6F22_017046 [Rhizopus arrhizus]|nr:hypothetical protein G6F22_017046 [Rhizopus arrhizus]
MLDDQAVRGVIQEFVVKNLRRWDAAGTVGEVLGLLTRDGRHQELLDAAMERLGGYLGEDDVKERASTLLVKFARKEWPRIIAAVYVIKSVDGIADNLADRLALALARLRSLGAELHRTPEDRPRLVGAGRRPEAAGHRPPQGAGVCAGPVGRHPRGAAARPVGRGFGTGPPSGKRLAGAGPQAGRRPELA